MGWVSPNAEEIKSEPRRRVSLSVTMSQSQELPSRRAPHHEPHPQKSKKKPKTQDHIGAPMWAKGSQFTYLWSFMESFNNTAPRSKARRELIKNIAVLFITKYRWDRVENPDPDDPDVDELVALSKALEGDGEEEINARKLILTEFREVLFYFCQKSDILLTIICNSN
jgi:hypothetical protein